MGWEKSIHLKTIISKAILLTASLTEMLGLFSITGISMLEKPKTTKQMDREFFIKMELHMEVHSNKTIWKVQAENNANSIYLRGNIKTEVRFRGNWHGI